MKTQKQMILNMLIDNSWVCVTEIMKKFVPDYRRRLCDLKKDGYILSGRPCQQHHHTSKILKEWHLVSSPQSHQTQDFELKYVDNSSIQKQMILI